MWVILWRGWGILTLPILAGTALVVLTVLTAIEKSFGLASPALAGLTMSVALASAAYVNWRVGKHFNNKSVRELVDKKTGETVFLKPKHDLFWIKMEYWSVPVALLAIIFFIATIATLLTK